MPSAFVPFEEAVLSGTKLPLGGEVTIPTVDLDPDAAAESGIRKGFKRGLPLGRVKAGRVNRLHAVMSQTNRLIIRRPDLGELFEGVCAVCVEAGRMDLAVIVMLDVGEIHRSTSGRLAVTPTPQRLLDGALMQRSLMTMVLQHGHQVVIDDASTDKRLNGASIWCRETGLSSLAAIPVHRNHVPVGILLLGSHTKAFFDGQGVLLIAELGADLSFAIDNADREKERHSVLLGEHEGALAAAANRAKNELLAQVSHELRTPLNAILGFAQLLATDKLETLSAPQAEKVRLITHAGWHLLGLVNDVMDISHIESGRLDVNNIDGDISAVLDEALALTQPLARINEVHLAELPPSKLGIGVVADPRRLLQVLLNLLGNACKYNRPGGWVKVEVTQGDEVFVDVVDNGVGVSQEHLLHLFEPYNRLGHTGHAIEGTGIGLTLTRQLVEMMNGRLEVESSVGVGTRVRVVLPACAIPLKPFFPAESRSPVAQPPAAASVVLCIEDDPVNRLLVQHMLQRCEGVHLVFAECGEEGVALAWSLQPNLVLLDMNLPDMTGLDVLDALRANPRTASLKVVAVSANPMEYDIASAKSKGVLDYWTKPLTLNTFVAGIESLLDDGRWSDTSHLQCAAVGMASDGERSGAIRDL